MIIDVLRARNAIITISAHIYASASLASMCTCICNKNSGKVSSTPSILKQQSELFPASPHSPATDTFSQSG